MDFTDIKIEILQLHAFFGKSLLSEILFGLLLSALKWQKVANYPRAEPKPLNIRWKPEKHFLQGYVNSYSVFRKIDWQRKVK